MPQASSYDTQTWVRKASRAAQEAAKGNARGAVYQAAPAAAYRVPDTQTKVYANLSRAGVSQPVPGVSNLSSRYLRLNSSYNASAGLRGFKGAPALSHGLNVSGQNRYIRNSTTITPGIPRISGDQSN